jgi:hypothetical protein
MPRYLHRPARAPEPGDALHPLRLSKGTLRQGAVRCPCAPELVEGLSAHSFSDIQAAISGGDGLEGTHLIGAGANDSGGRLGHFVPGAGEVAEGFGNYQSSLLTQAVQDLHLGMQLT